MYNQFRRKITANKCKKPHKNAIVLKYFDLIPIYFIRVFTYPGYLYMPFL